MALIAITTLKCDCMYYAAPAQQIQAAVVAKQRPNLQEIQGPADYVAFAREYTEKCWNGDPDQRPSFGGENRFHVYIN